MDCANPSVKKKKKKLYNLSWKEENMPIQDICICDEYRKHTMMCFLASTHAWYFLIPFPST